MTTIRDVAAKAGVHPSTVSRTFSGKARISSSTRQRVLAAAECLGFQPHAIARSLSVRRTNTIGVVVSHIFPQVMQGLFSAAYGRGYRVLVSGSNGHADEVTQTCQMLRSGQVDGIVLLSSLRVSYAVMAGKAIQALIDGIDGVVQERIQKVISCDLIIRSFSGPVPRTRM